MAILQSTTIQGELKTTNSSNSSLGDNTNSFNSGAIKEISTNTIKFLDSSTNTPNKIYFFWNQNIG